MMRNPRACGSGRARRSGESAPRGSYGESRDPILAPGDATMRKVFRSLITLGLMSAFSAPASADSVLFSTNPNPDGAMAMASRPGVGGKTEIEAGDDFFTTATSQIT